MKIKGKSLLFPVKIADSEYVKSYSEKLINGEEQLIITRDCGLYLTDGQGGYIEFKTINAGITLLEVQELLDNLNTELSDKITSLDTKLSKEIDDINSNINTITNTINQLITDINLKFEGYVTKEDYNKKVEEYDGKIIEYDTDIKSLKDSIAAEVHINRDILDKFSESDDGTPLYNGKKIIADFSLDTLPTFGIGGDTNG